MSAGSIRRWAKSFRIVLAIALAALSGCKSFNWKGDGFHDDMAHWGEKQRPPDQTSDSSSEMLGLSAKSQQIERNLGVR